MFSGLIAETINLQKPKQSHYVDISLRFLLSVGQNRFHQHNTKHLDGACLVQHAIPLAQFIQQKQRGMNQIFSLAHALCSDLNPYRHIRDLIDNSKSSPYFKLHIVLS